jgi:hypothetical protein
MSIAATAIAETGKPVGLLVWRGRHAWVMSGFVATADPAVTTDFQVTHAVVLDPLYPHGSKTWGPSPKPREAIAVSTLGQQFVPRGTGARSLSWMSSFAGKYVMVVPMRPMLDRHAGMRSARHRRSGAHASSKVAAGTCGAVRDGMDRHPSAERRKMFGHPCAFVGGNMATGLFADSWMVRLPDTERTELLPSTAPGRSRWPAG